LEDLEQNQHADRPGPVALDRLLRERGAVVVSYEDWLKINAAETQRAAGEKPREKFARVAEMLAVLNH
jgi:ferredoxin--NADP+ reductase